jgi:hypothetical protein
MTVDLLTSVGASVLSSSALVAALHFLTREWLTTRLTNSIRHEYDQKLEVFKADLKAKSDVALVQLTADLERNATQISVAHASFSEGQKAAMARRLQAVDELWRWVVKFRKDRPAILGFLSLLSDDELRAQDTQNRVSEYTVGVKWESFLPLVNSDIEATRPYIGEQAWATVWAYRAIMLRISYLALEARSDLSLLHWVSDQGILDILSAVVTPEEFKEYSGLRVGRIGWITTNMEAKILSAAHGVISGEQLGTASLKQAMELQKMAANLGRPGELVNGI